MARNKQNLTFIFDFGHPTASVETWKAIRRVMATLQQDYSIIRLLVTNPPTTSDLGLQKPSEVLLECDKERKECLETLRFNNIQYERISKHYGHTFKWPWESPEYCAWKPSEYSSLLFIEGKPGSGKSTLVRYFAEHFLLMPEADGAIIAKYFYSHQDGELERDHRNMLRSLLYEILKADESFFIHFQQAYREVRGSEFDLPLAETWSLETLKDVLRACTKHPLKRRIFLIVDAIDESDNDGRVDIVQFLSNLSFFAKKDCVLKVFLASRPIAEFDQDFTHRILLQEKNRKDIESYTHASLQKLGSTQSRLLGFLKSLPEKLESYYVYMLYGLNGNDEDDTRDDTRILQFCLFSHRGIQFGELDYALAIPGEIKDPPPDPFFWEAERPTGVRKRLTHCAGSFVEIKNSPISCLDDTDKHAIIQVMHQTAREFLLYPHEAVIRSHFRAVANVQQGRIMIRTTCIRYLILHHQELMSNFQSPARDWSPKDYDEFLQYLDSRPFIGYSLEFLMLSKNDVDPDISRLISDPKCPPSVAFCHLSRLVDSSIDAANV
ncbi:hypothetical protein BDD12DRAFT_803176 [Trichophaea hybrida]|nr:hypothetical protein BDD12DRAFT_803176 [Trichophaea hybrida]